MFSEHAPDSRFRPEALAMRERERASLADENFSRPSLRSLASFDITALILRKVPPGLVAAFFPGIFEILPFVIFASRVFCDDDPARPPEAARRA